jgi:hypothetical protein
MSVYYSQTNTPKHNSQSTPRTRVEENERYKINEEFSHSEGYS